METKTMTAQDLANPKAAEVDPEAVARRKEQRKQMDAPKGRTTWKKRPEDVVIAGVDYPADLDDPFYDERVDLSIDPDFVADIDLNGVKQPPTGAMDGELFKASDGRRRILHARAANVLRRARGEAELIVECFIDKGDAKHIFLTARRSNAYARTDGTLQKARNAKRALERFGASYEEVAGAENTTPEAVREWLRVLELSVDAQKAIDSGATSAKAALKLLENVPRKDQNRVLSEALSALPAGKSLTTRDAEAAGKNERKRREKPSLPVGEGDDDGANTAEPAPKKRVLKKLILAHEKGELKKVLGGGDKLEGFIIALRYTLGDKSRKSIAGLTEALRALGVVE